MAIAIRPASASDSCARLSWRRQPRPAAQTGPPAPARRRPTATPGRSRRRRMRGWRARTDAGRGRVAHAALRAAARRQRRRGGPPVVEHERAAVPARSSAGRRRGPSGASRLGERLRLRRAVGATRCGLHDTGPGRLAGRWVDQVMGEAVRRSARSGEPGRWWRSRPLASGKRRSWRRRADARPRRSGALPRSRRTTMSPPTSTAKLSCHQQGRRAVGRVALGAAAEVEAHAGRPANRAVGDRHLLPCRACPRPRGAARRRLQERLAQVGGLDAHARVA